MENKFSNKIEEIMTSSMNNLKSLIDVDVVVGKPIYSGDSLVIIPLTKIIMGYVAGGGQYNSEIKALKKDAEYPFSGGSGGGLNLQPIGFLVINGKTVEVVKIDEKTALEKLIDVVPEITNFINKNFSKKGQK